MKKLIIIGVLLLLHIESTYSQVVYKEVKAKIDIENIENSLSIKGTVENLNSVYKNIFFKLSVFKKNIKNTNKSDNAQDGRVALEPLQKVILSKTQINITSDDRIIILLLIYDENNEIIGKDRIVIGEKEEQKIGMHEAKDGIEISGIVSNETKTKLGNDFYDMFYSAFTSLQKKSNKIITVQEELTFGRTTKILVSVDGEIIEEFITRPEEEFLKYMAQDSSSKVFQYLKNIEKQTKMITQY